MNKFLAGVFLVIIILVAGFGIFVSCTPQGIALWNGYEYGLQKAEDRTAYASLRKVEDTCRAMISSYNSDKLVYDQYKTSTNEEKQGWAEQAKMRANKTASTYNNYVLQNTFVWKNNIPSDIYMTLSYID